MKRSPSLFLLFCLLMPIVILTLSNAFVNIIFQLALPIKNPSLFGISSNNWNSLVTSTLAS